jgi:hypothetical protein
MQFINAYRGTETHYSLEEETEALVALAIAVGMEPLFALEGEKLRVRFDAVAGKASHPDPKDFRHE